MLHNIGLTNSQIAEIIDEQIHSERDRRILKMKLIDGITYERIAEAVEMSPRQIKTIVSRMAALKLHE